MPLIHLTLRRFYKLVQFPFQQFGRQEFRDILPNLDIALAELQQFDLFVIALGT
ncbi:MAG: hypothetical protein K9J37_21030 [Saprospiraceae bacterium]|nr:hypothetical protein [Saprospiraceae bacterium]MCF8252404.1 hypothetical protein [Saprospiraceae bacterium]MCF8282274.1 hypothetical protein [Bacteroidales bacterium]MCF8313972.1 hypothetical protein [Saprospiraceae bacterium]MCF8442734.1 hypothetical protein [Saprospiraceae bacterium]